MSNWALVENNKIKELCNVLPMSWRNISGLRNSSDNLQFLNSIGWYSIVKKHQEYDKELYEATGLNHVFLNDSVIETLILTEKVKPNTSDIMSFLSELRKERNEKLLLSDWTQLNDVLEKMDDIEKTKWAIYRQMLRDLPEKCIFSGITNMDEVIWPDFETIDVYGV
jgi:hypothetical protein